MNSFRRLTYHGRMSAGMGESHGPGGRPFGAAGKGDDERRGLNGRAVVTKGVDVYPALSPLGGPQHRLVESGTRNGLPRFALIQGVIVPSGREHVERTFGLPAKICVEFVLGLRELHFEPLGYGVAGVGHFHGEVVGGGMVAMVGPPVTAADLFEVGPTVESGQRKVVEEKPLAVADGLEKRVIGIGAPAQSRLCASRRN